MHKCIPYGVANRLCKANIADVAKLYICIKQDQRLEDLNFIGDINHDGLLTIIDVARLYSHVTGRKPL